MSQQIKQILNASGPLFAVSRGEEGLILDECPILALIDDDGCQSVVGLCLTGTGYDNPSDAQNFLGYAASLTEANEKFRVRPE